MVKNCIIILLCLFSLQALASGQALSDRIVSISATFLNKPYQLDPLGEGPQGQFSQKPLYRFDRFDCQTYVETVLALALTQQETQKFQQQLLKIRYSNGKPDYFTRNHFPSIDWIPNNIHKGYIKFSPIDTDRISMVINKQQWLESKTHILDNKISAHVKVVLPYISISHLSQNDKISDIPNGAIIMIVKPSFLLITHMGFAIWKNNTLYLRAASSLHHKVIDLPLLPYLEDQSKYGVKGIVVLIPA